MDMCVGIFGQLPIFIGTLNGNQLITIWHLGRFKHIMVFLTVWSDLRQLKSDGLRQSPNYDSSESGLTL